jgi:hypothetical protein
MWSPGRFVVHPMYNPMSHGTCHPTQGAVRGAVVHTELVCSLSRLYVVGGPGEAWQTQIHTAATHNTLVARGSSTLAAGALPE